MPLVPTPSTEELEDHFFGSGAFTWGWFTCDQYEHFPVVVSDVEEFGEVISSKTFTQETFIEGIKLYAESHPTKSYQDLLEDMDATDVDNCIQLAFFGEIRYA